MSLGDQLSTLQIAGGPYGATVDVRLNGEKVPGLRSLTVYLEDDGITNAVLEISVGSVEMDVETYTELQAIMKITKDDNESD